MSYPHLHRTTALPRVVDRRVHQFGHHEAEVGVLAHIRRILPAELEPDGLEADLLGLEHYILERINCAYGSM